MSVERTGTLLLFATLAWLVSVGLGTVGIVSESTAVVLSVVSLVAIVGLVAHRTIQGPFGSRH